MHNSAFHRVSIKRIFSFIVSILFILSAGCLFSVFADVEKEPDLVVSVEDCGTVEVSIKDITSRDANDEDIKLLMSLLQIKIVADNKVIYNGPCDKVPSPVLTWTLLKRNTELIVDATITVPKYEADNKIQGIPFEMAWGFHARGENGSVVRLNKETFYTNPNIDPGDVFGYRIKIINKGDRDDTTRPYVKPTTKPTKIRTGDDTEFTSKMSGALIMAACVVMVCVIVAIFFPLIYKRGRKNKNTD